MKALFFVIMIIIAYVAGYLTPKSFPPLSEAVSSSSQIMEVVNNSVVIESLTATHVAKSHSHEKSSVSRDASNNPGVDKNSAESNSETNSVSAPELGFSDQPASDGGINEAITDAEIDKFVPAPFNKYLKGNRGYMRDRYRKFVDQEQPADLDTGLQNRLSDAIFSNPYAKYLDIEAMQCRAGLCEIRLYERKIGVWSYIQAEMSLQDWWTFTNSSAHGFDTEDKNKQGWYVLLTN